MAISVFSYLCHRSFPLPAIYLDVEVTVWSAPEQNPHWSAHRLFQAPDTKPGASAQSQLQTLKALSLPLLRVRFTVGFGGGGVDWNRSHAPFVRGNIISPFGSWKFMPSVGGIFTHDLRLFVVHDHPKSA